MNFVDSLKKWFFNNSSSAATTTSKVPLVDNTGNPIGCDTLAHLAQVQDLASVLGESVSSTSDLNTLFGDIKVSSWGIKRFNQNSTGSPLQSAEGYVFSFKHMYNGWGSQVVISNGGIYTRAFQSGTPTDWKTVTLT